MAHGCEDLWFNPRSLLSRHPASSLFFWSPVLFSRFSGCVVSVLIGLIKGCWATDTSRLASSLPQKSHSLKSAGSGPDFPDSLSSHSTFQTPNISAQETTSEWSEII